MKKLFVISFGLIMVIAMGGCLDLGEIFPFLNQSPVIISEPVITATEDQLYSYQVEASDPNGDTLIYSFIVKPEGMNINSENGLIIWTPTNDQVGISYIEVEISDSKLSVTQNFEIEVFNVNNPPKIFSYSPINLNVTVNEGDSIKFEVQAYDIDSNTTLNFQWFLNEKLVSNSTVLGNDSKNSWNYFAGCGGHGQKRVKVLVNDGELQDFVQWNIAINDITPPAQLTLVTIISPTNIPMQALSGTKESNTSIWINGVAVIPINPNTTWTYNFNLSEGGNNISITSKDAAGNESLSISANIFLDTISPMAPTLNSIISPNNISTQILSGTKEADTSILINGVEVILINSETIWSYNLHLTEGTNSVLITSCDTTGNESSSVSTTIVLDISIPETPTLDDVISPTNISPQILSGIKETNTSIWINGAEVVPVNLFTGWCYYLSLTEGTNNISITSCDAVGNESFAVNAIVILDTIKPAAPTIDTITSPTNISPQTLSGTKEINASVWINNIEVIPVNPSTTWSYNFNLSEGGNNISIISKDTVGNESSENNITIILDTIAPTIPTLEAVTSPTNISSQALSGTKEANTSIWFNGTEVTPFNSSTDWSHSYNLSEGSNNIEITSRDTVGNESTAVNTTIEYDPNTYVDIENTSGIEDGTQTYPFNTIIEGIDAVTPGKSVIVAEGTYNEQFIINKSMTIKKVDESSANSTTITGSDKSGNLITVIADDVTISGFTIDGNSDTDVGIYSGSSSSIKISENIIQNHRDSGILYHRASYDYPSGIYAYNNEICYNSQNGIKITGAGSGIIELNTIRNSNYGIKASNDTSLEVKMNDIHNNSDSGIFCRNNSSLLIWSNNITSNGCGIRVGERYSDTANPDIGGGDRDGIGKNNIFSNNTTLHGVSNMTGHNILAKYNWWGDDDGPKYPNNSNPGGNAALSSDWAYWDNVSNKAGAIIFDDHLTEPQIF